MTQAAQREQIHRLIDVVSPEQLTALSVLLEVMVDSSTRKFAAAPREDESIGAEENVQATAELGPMYSIEQVLADLDITHADLERQRQADEIANRLR
ncbi:MAG TPA: hypothetical protein VGU46_03080 [Acidobacteriaceae bacterium]|nr:hypothetical protein [Acidobacteriaceae bacterium]